MDWEYIEVPAAEMPDTLTDREREVIEMRMNKYSYQEIAEAFGYKSANTVTYWIKHHIRPKFLRIRVS
jgi:DNA-binding CsgD family transcriptional regulator